uniref:RZ-type domain-containing protein n=1 Tax=Timema bartmani TaxID=61472 RepID=A0A7R9I635_9NEOP|nr:unnamed protein product [Timema bartmani]
MADLTSKIERKQERLELTKKNEGILWMNYLVDRNIIPSGFLGVLRTSLVEWLLVPPEEWPEEEEGLDDEAQQLHEQENLEESHTENGVSELYYTLLDELLEDDRYDETDHYLDFRPAPIFYVREDIYEISLEKLDNQLKEVEGILEDLKDGGYSDRNIWFFETLYDDLTYQKKCLKTCLRQVIPYDEERVEKLVTEPDVWRIDPRDRWLLYKHWLSLLQAALLEDLIQAGEDFTEETSFYEEVRHMSDLRILRERHVVGMTTTGAARLQPLLQALRPTIVIVEEAAEVLESHIVASLTKDCQHLILIGYNIPRMLNNGMHCKVLQLQHRMRPEIAELITPTIYPVLMNHSSVETYPDVKGMLKNVFFVKHNKPEAQDGESSSHSNRHEAEFLLALCQYLILQGYDGEDITILTTYSGQMFYLREKRSKHLMLHKVRMTVVDNFQGEENKIILLSLVRSNKDASIGFLKTPNRVCVALSRAREGLYIIGNMDNLTERSSSVWGEIKETLVKQEALGTHLTLRCQNHPDQVTLVASHEDFKQVKEGGCKLPCMALLKCGHTCKSVCHRKDLEHENKKCLEPCERILCALEHNCKKMCWEECGPCSYLLLKTPPCGHEATVQCHVTSDNIVCEVDPLKFGCPFKCEDRLMCGHACDKTCHPLEDPEHLEFQCKKKCARLNKDCSLAHECRLLCYQECADCSVILEPQTLTCGHSHKLKCSQDPATVKCAFKCNRTLPCGHPCASLCHKACAPCVQKVTKVIPDCGHKVNIWCSAEVSREDCTKFCERIMECGHKCPDKCFLECSVSRCNVLVPCDVQAACGHAGNILCRLAKSELAITPLELLQYCEVPCGAALECGHTCHGSCRACLQGRIHARCKEKCGKTLICGHSCGTACANDCPPCRRKCKFRCAHSRCPKKCGEPCVPCKEPCPWKCKHFKCKKRCSDMCDRPPCSEPCKKDLQCGHPCIGFCGEPCPPLCRVCDKEVVTVVFLGQEDELDARFVYLEDCHHVVEAQGLETWLGQSDGEIAMKVSGSSVTLIDKESLKLLSKNKRNNLSSHDAETLGIQIQILEQLEDAFVSAARVSNDSGKKKMIKFVDQLIQVIIERDDYLSQQEVKEINIELQRFHRLSQMITIESLYSFQTTIKQHGKMQDYEEANKVLDSIKKYTGDKDDRVNQIIRDLQSILRNSLEFHENERKEIVKAMGLKQGHWFKCPNGHIYVITECGGAMEVGKCNECGAAIGGTQHRLLDTNELAREMDNATNAAWSDTTNIENYALDVE